MLSLSSPRRQNGLSKTPAAPTEAVFGFGATFLLDRGGTKLSKNVIAVRDMLGLYEEKRLQDGAG